MPTTRALATLLCSFSVGLTGCASLTSQQSSPIALEQEQADACVQLQQLAPHENSMDDVKAPGGMQGSLQVLDTEALEDTPSPFDSVLKDWEHLSFFPFKAPTQFTVLACADRGNHRVLGVDAQGSASSMVRTINRNTNAQSRVKWKWRVAKANSKANTRDRAREDSPIRVVLTFDGDKSKLKEEEQGFLQRMEMLTRRPAPYATLMYSVGAGVEPNEIISPAYSQTIKIKAVHIQQNKNRPEDWQAFDRNIEADFVKAFGERPGRLMNIAIMGDADNTRESSRAYIADLELSGLQQESGH